MTSIHFVPFALGLLGVTFSATLSAQCNSVVLTSQGQVDAFQCTTVDHLTIRSGATTPIVNLNGLWSLTAVTGALTIEHNPQLVDTFGLTNLASIGGDLRVSDNGALPNLDGLDSLATVGGVIRIVDNPALVDVAGLSRVDESGGVHIQSNAALREVGLTRLAVVRGAVLLDSNPTLSNLDGFESLADVSGTFLAGSNGLQDLRGLSSLRVVEGQLEVRDNPGLTDFCGLYPLLRHGHVGSTNFSNNGASTSVSSILAAGECGPARLVLPDGFERSHTGHSIYHWRTNTFRFQTNYDESHFLDQGIDHPIEIDRLRFRAQDAVVWPGGQSYPNITIDLSSSPNDFSTMSAYFAPNIGVDVVRVFDGVVTLLPAHGSAPNDYVIDIRLQTPFRYDPTAGLDLCIDVLSTTYPTAAVPPLATSHDAALHRVRTTSFHDITSPGGGLSGFGAAMKIDFRIPTDTGIAEPYGDGCPNRFVSFYEESAPGRFRLGASGPGVVNSIRLTPNGQGGYDVGPGTNQWYAPTSPDLGLGDDAMSTAQALPFSLSYPGGTTSQVFVESNGNVWLQQPTHTGPYYCLPGSEALLSRGPVICAAYHDLDPSAATGGGSVHFDVDAAAGVAYVTWDQVPVWVEAPPTPRPHNTFQVAIHDTGVVELRFQEMNTSLSWCSNMTGFSPGANNRDPGSAHLAFELPISTGTDAMPLRLSTRDRPLLGSTVQLDATEIPSTALLSTTIVSFTRLRSPLDGIGMPGCFQHVGSDVGLGVAGGNPQASFSFGITNDPAFLGLPIRAQSLSLVPNANPLGALASNGVELVLGNQ